MAQLVRLTGVSKGTVGRAVLPIESAHAWLKILRPRLSSGATEAEQLFQHFDELPDARSIIRLQRLTLELFLQALLLAFKGFLHLAPLHQETNAK